ncbi:acid phosphatase/Vanadium-dependent haloperoxidase [Apiospora phragmitis]|uniref:Acid phosphatase/Vanadium-dependent haloperoxidase n=1 Tax=Apiospora phragmitis TaxID=2905665 RepID=A0ABR1T2E0_9PEZI
MGLFNKRTRQEPAQPRAAKPKRGGLFGGGKKNSANHAGAHYSMAKRPTFGQWLKFTWLDILTMAAMGAIGLGVYMAHPAPTRSFAVQFSDGEVVHPDFAYPLRKEIIPIVAAALLAAFIPIIVILICQIRVRSFWDVNNGVIGLLYSLITAAVFQVFVKWLIGGLRPHFLNVCKPDVTRASNAPGVKGAGYNGAGFTGIYYTSEICTGDPKEINDSLESMPSGHTTAAFAGFVYLYLYLNAKLKVFSNYHPAMWKLVVIYAPILGACLIGGALTIDEYHNWYDVFAGAVIGTVMAFSAYRMVYASIWDFRFNHIPLNRGTPFPYTGGAELAHAMFTRKAGWGGGSVGAHGSDKHIGGEGHGLHNNGTATDGAYNNGTYGNDAGMSHSRKPVGHGVGAGHDAGHVPARHADDMV